MLRNARRIILASPSDSNVRIGNSACLVSRGSQLTKRGFRGVGQKLKGFKILLEGRDGE